MLGANRLSFDLTKGKNTGRLIINCKPPYEQPLIYFYGIKIDENELLKVPKFSIISIELDSGTHNIEIYAIPNTMQFLYGQSFGSKTKETVELEPKKTIVYDYTGPAVFFRHFRALRGNFQ